jgi:hypothetical protein
MINAPKRLQMEQGYNGYPAEDLEGRDINAKDATAESSR